MFFKREEVIESINVIFATDPNNVHNMLASRKIVIQYPGKPPVANEVLFMEIAILLKTQVVP